MDELIIPIDPQEDLQDDPQVPQSPQDDPQVINDPQGQQDDLCLIEISPNGNYLVVYSEKDSKFIGWNVKKDEEKNIQTGEYVINEEGENKQVEPENHEKESEHKQVEPEGYEKESEHKQVEDKFNPDRIVEEDNDERRIRRICVSDKKILAYIYDYDEDEPTSYIEIIDMGPKHGQIIKSYFEFDKMEVQFCNFNLDGELILWCTGETNIYNDGFKMLNIVCVYLIQSGKAKCQKMYAIPIEAEVISISKYDKIWLRFNNNIYEWDIPTAHTTIILKNEIKSNINISNNKEYTCFKLSNERIIIYSNKLGFPIAILDLNYLENKDQNNSNQEGSKESQDQKDSKDKQKRDKLIKRLYNLMIKYPSLSVLLLSLLDHTCLNELVENLNENSSNLLNLFCRSEPEPNRQHNQHNNYRFVYHHNDNRIQVNEFKLKEKLKANNYEHENLTFSKLYNLKNPKDVLGTYQLEKGSIIWKFKIEELEKQKISIVELKLVKIKEKINNLVNKINKTNKEGIKAVDLDKFNERLGELKRWSSDDDLIKDFETRIAEIEKFIAEIEILKENFINWKEEIKSNSKVDKSVKDKVESLIEEVNRELTEQTKQKIKMKLKKYFVGRITKKGFDDESKQLVENFIKQIQEIIKSENLKENDYSNILVDELKKDTKDFFKKFGGMFKDKNVDIVEEFEKLKDDFDKFRTLVKEIISEIKNAKGTTHMSYIKEIDDMKYTDDNERKGKIEEFVKMFIKVTNIEVSVKKFIKQVLKNNIPIKGLDKDYLIDVKLTDSDIDAAVKITMDKFIKAITRKGYQDTVPTEMVKVMENFIEDINKEEKDSKNISVKSVNFIQMIIKPNKNEDLVAKIKNLKKDNKLQDIKEDIEPKDIREVNKPAEDTKEDSKPKDTKEDNKPKDTKEDNKPKDTKDEYNNIFEGIVNNFIEEIEKIKVKESENNIQMIANSIASDTNKQKNIFDDMEKDIIKESAKKFIRKKMEIKIDRLKVDFITNIEKIIKQKLQNSMIEKSVSKFIDVIEELDKIDITNIEKLVEEFIKPKVYSTVENNPEEEKKDVDEIKKSVRKFIEWIDELGDPNIKKDSNKRITKLKKLENLIREIEITKTKELEEDPNKLADDFVNYIKIKIEALEKEKDPKLAKDIIHDIRKTKIDELNENIEELTEDKVKKFINDVVILKINEELVKDSIERVKKFEKLEKLET